MTLYRRSLRTSSRYIAIRYLRLQFMVSLIAVAAVAAALFSICEIAAATPPHVVYRVDERTPDEIFRTGFEPWGRNDYLLAHVLGESLLSDVPEQQRSYFVATTATLDAAYQIARARWRYAPALRTAPLYIYEIRATQNFYDVDRYMDAIEQNPPEGENRQVIAAARRAYRYQREWAAAGPIDFRQVRWAREIRYRDDRIGDFREFVNDRRTDENTVANDGIYPILGRQPFHRVRPEAFILNSTVEFLHGFAVSLAYCPLPPAPRYLAMLSSTRECNEPTEVRLDGFRPDPSALPVLEADYFMLFVGK